MFGSLGQRIGDFQKMAQHLFLIAGRTLTDRASMKGCALTIPKIQGPILAKLKTTVKRWRCWFRTSFGWMEHIRTRMEQDTIQCGQATSLCVSLDRLAPSILS